DAPARAVGELVVGDFADDAALTRVARGAAVATYEWEGVPAAAVSRLAASVPVRPGDRSLERAQDRYFGKQVCRALAVATAPCAPAAPRARRGGAVLEMGPPAVLKTRRGGYDGKGQRVLRDDPDVAPAWDELGSVPLILEGFVEFRRELSIVA